MSINLVHTFDLASAAQWIQNQKYLKLVVDKGVITITDGVTVEASGKDLPEVVNKIQAILTKMKRNKETNG